MFKLNNNHSFTHSLTLSQCLGHLPLVVWGIKFYQCQYIHRTCCICIQKLVQVPLTQIIWNFYTRSGIIKRRPISISDFTSSSVLELYPLICRKIPVNTLAGSRGIRVLWTHSSHKTLWIRDRYLFSKIKIKCCLK